MIFFNEFQKEKNVIHFNSEHSGEDTAQQRFQNLQYFPAANYSRARR